MDNELDDFINEPTSKVKDPLEVMAAKYGKTRSDISNEIRESIEIMSTGLKGLKEVQVKMLSMRQRLLEDSHILIENLSSVKKAYRNARSKQMEDLSTNLQHRYQYNEKTVIIDGKTANIKEVVDTIENQISFFVDSIKTVDNVLFGIKTRVEIEKTLGM
jgi:hydroxymethylpyrimidine/phosphomethylpyrimidine kinase